MSFLFRRRRAIELARLLAALEELALERRT
jgi:hypothetical protein